MPSRSFRIVSRAVSMASCSAFRFSFVCSFSSSSFKRITSTSASTRERASASDCSTAASRRDSFSSSSRSWSMHPFTRWYCSCTFFSFPSSSTRALFKMVRLDSYSRSRFSRQRLCSSSRVRISDLNTP